MLAAISPLLTALPEMAAADNVMDATKAGVVGDGTTLNTASIQKANRAAVPTSTSLPATISLAGIWNFQLDPQGEGVKAEWFKAPLKDQMQLPGTTDEQQKGYKNDSREVGRFTRANAYYGPAWYQREIEIPVAWQGKHITFLMERTKTTMVWVDEKLIGSQNTLAASQVYDLSEALTPGKHRITVCIDNKKTPPVGDPHQISDQTQTNWNGVVGRLELRVTDPVWIDEVQVYPDVPRRKVRVRLVFGNSQDIPVQGTLTLSGQSWNVAKPHTLKPARIKFQARTDNSFENDFADSLRSRTSGAGGFSHRIS